MDQIQGLAWSPEEDQTILLAHMWFGDKWAAIACLLSARTGSEIENYWNSTLNWKRQAVRGVSGHQPPSISDMARDNVSQPSGGVLRVGLW
ncbi:transcription factor MYB44-like protein [Tanacetum coccineum]